MSLMCHFFQDDSAMALQDIVLISLLLLPSGLFVTGSGTDEHNFTDSAELPHTATGAVQYDNAPSLQTCVPQAMSTNVMNNYVQTQPMREYAIDGSSTQNDIDRANQVTNSVLVMMKRYTAAALCATRSVTASRYTRRVIAGRRCSGRISRQTAGVKLSRSVRIGIKSNQIVVPRRTHEIGRIGAAKSVVRHADTAWETRWFSFVATATRIIKNMFTHEYNARKFHVARGSPGRRSTRRLTFRKGPETGNTADVKVLETGHPALITSAKDKLRRTAILLKSPSISHSYTHQPATTYDTILDAEDDIAPMSEGSIKNASLLVEGQPSNMSSFDGGSCVRDRCIVDIKMTADRKTPEHLYGNI